MLKMNLFKENIYWNCERIFFEDNTRKFASFDFKLVIRH